MTRSDPNSGLLLQETLRIGLVDRIPELPEEVWWRVFDIATDPLTPQLGSDLIPVDDVDENRSVVFDFEEFPVDQLPNGNIDDAPLQEFVDDTTNPELWQPRSTRAVPVIPAPQRWNRDP